MAEVNYSEEHIRSLDWKEHIRLRPGMYIGKLGDGSADDDGIYVLLKEMLDNCIDEYVMGYGKKIEVDDRRHARGGARLRPRRAAGQGDRRGEQDQHRRQVRQQGLQEERGPERRGHEGRERAEPATSRSRACATAR